MRNAADGPTKAIGDASPIGYLRRLVDGSELSYWVPGIRTFGTEVRLTVDIRLHPENDGSRLVIRMSADATGAMARPALWFFMLIDSIMATRQLVGIKERVEAHGARTTDPEHPESGARDQYQLYEVIYASGETAGDSSLAAPSSKGVMVVGSSRSCQRIRSIPLPGTSSRKSKAPSGAISAVRRLFC